MDIQCLNKTVTHIYSSSVQTKTSIPFKCYLHTIIGDSPEKRSFISYAASSGLFACWFGYSAILNKMQAFPSCNSCFKRRLDAMNMKMNMESNCCDRCVDWTMDFNNRLLLFEAPAGYPSEFSDIVEWNGKVLLKPFKVSMKLMMNAAHHSFRQYVNGNWTKKNLELYLSRFCMNGDYISMVCTNAIRMKGVQSPRRSTGQMAYNEMKKLQLVRYSIFRLSYSV